MCPGERNCPEARGRSCPDARVQPCSRASKMLALAGLVRRARRARRRLIQPRTRNNVVGQSDDLEFIEINMPAEYTTAECNVEREV